ncbi:hypothetical protein NPS01_42660 [Nocardioides psychrotolerans]|uniref:AAA domain-containing protein n=1 Tax=Nocardioides psychrotolerans TaxID=1005945 RepID=A0A1I3MC53_9ACTN|nr:AAA family ATPase [Nocardioides psychrotolerans]GEP40603.1 hypothetical protein NPS01_42660 [Nocardioides psychrotolerans]SFI94370.1 AAA domain-containing protein [Nocardioides psychrotolerans]
MTEYADANALGLAPMGGPNEDDEDLARRLELVRDHRRQVDIEKGRILAREQAHAEIRADKVADTDFASLYLSRSQLLNMPTPQPLIDNVLPRHSYVILRGRDQSFKSFVALDWACCLATGKPWQGHTAKPTPVLYVAGEGGYGLARRIEAWEYAWSHLIDDRMLTVRNGALDLHRPGPAFDDLLDVVRRGQYGLVVIDTLRRVSGNADGNSSEMGVVVDNLDRIRQETTDGTVLAVAHTDKGDNDARGYSGIEDDADVVWSVKRDDMYLALELAKMKDGPDGRTVHLLANKTLDSLTLSATGGLPKPNTTESQIKFLDVLRASDPDGMPSGRLMSLCTAAGIGESTYYRVARELAEAGHIVNLGTQQRKVWAIPPIEDRSHDLSPQETAPDLGGSHNSHDSQPALSLTTLTLTSLKGESEREVREDPS